MHRTRDSLRAMGPKAGGSDATLVVVASRLPLQRARAAGAWGNHSASGTRSRRGRRLPLQNDEDSAPSRAPSTAVRSLPVGRAMDRMIDRSRSLHAAVRPHFGREPIKVIHKDLLLGREKKNLHEGSRNGDRWDGKNGDMDGGSECSSRKNQLSGRHRPTVH